MPDAVPPKKPRIVLPDGREIEIVFKQFGEETISKVPDYRHTWKEPRETQEAVWCKNGGKAVDRLCFQECLVRCWGKSNEDAAKLVTVEQTCDTCNGTGWVPVESSDATSGA